MSTDILPSAGRVARAERFRLAPFLFVLSSGDPEWDDRWGSSNEPTPDLETTDVLEPFGYLRPTIQDFLVLDAAGSIISNGGARYSISDVPTKVVRIRLSIPTGAFAGQTIREVGLFDTPTFRAGLPPGQTVLQASDVVSKGRLANLHWRLPLPLAEGDTFARNVIVRF